jgi:AcrR family transcriptional regulator
MEAVNENPTRKPGRPKVLGDDERRQLIVQGAHGAFVELGFARTTTAVVAARAKVSKRALYDLFENKMELFAAVIREHKHLILDLPRPPGESLPLLDTLIRIFRLDIDDAAEQAREAMLNLIARESVQFPELSDYLYQNEVLRSREALLDWLRQEHESERLVVEDPQLIAGMLMDVVFGALLPRRRLLNADERALRTAHIKQRLAIVLRGLQAEAH